MLTLMNAYKMLRNKINTKNAYQVVDQQKVDLRNFYTKIYAAAAAVELRLRLRPRLRLGTRAAGRGLTATKTPFFFTDMAGGHGS